MRGARVREFLRVLVANDVAKLKTYGKALYTCMLNADGGVIDDLIIYFIADTDYRLIVNAATREKDLAWIRQAGCAVRRRGRRARRTGDDRCAGTAGAEAGGAADRCRGRATPRWR